MKILTALILLLMILPFYTLSVGDPAPDFTLTDIDGGTFKLSRERGKGVIVEFFATWCGGCKDEVPELKEVYETVEEGLTIISISIDPTRDTDEVLRAFRDKYGISWVIARDTEGVTEAYGVTGLPTIFIVNQEGAIHFEHAGLISAEDIITELEELGIPEFSGFFILIVLIATISAVLLGRKYRRAHLA